MPEAGALGAAPSAGAAITAGTAGTAQKAEVFWGKVAAAIFMMVLTAGILYADYAIRLDVCFNVLVAALTVWSLVEFYRMCESTNTSPFRKFGIAISTLLVFVHWVGTPGTLATMGVSQEIEKRIVEEVVRFGLMVAVLGALWLQSTKRDNNRTFESISSTLFGVLYVWFLPSFLVKLRHLGLDGYPAGRDWNFVGSCLLLSTLAVSKMSDVGGYLFGRKFGRHRIIPRISPRKSYEGFFAGLALSVGVACLLHAMDLLPLGGWWQAGLFGAAVGGVAVLGDLGESLLKRGSGRKDAGDVIPGFGGILDVIDSLTVSAPVAYFLSILLLRLKGV